MENQKDLMAILEWMNGYDKTNGQPKANISYQQYVLEDEKHPDHIRTMIAGKLAVNISVDKYNSNIIRITIHTRSVSEPEYRILWAAIQKHMKLLSDPAYLEKTPILFFLFVSNQQVQEEKTDTIINIQAINPFCIHNYAENPQTGIIDTIELLFLADNISYEMDRDAQYGLSDMKKELDMQFVKEKDEKEKKESETYHS